MYAVFQTGGKQFRAEPGTRLRIPSLEAEPGATVTFDDVLLAGDGGDNVLVGTPTVEGATVKAEVLRHGRTPKIIVFKRKRRKGYRRKQGHRQGFTEIRVDEVALA
jgi:large subunit ribosomal protein L21